MRLTLRHATQCLLELLKVSALTTGNVARLLLLLAVRTLSPRFVGYVASSRPGCAGCMPGLLLILQRELPRELFVESEIGLLILLNKGSVVILGQEKRRTSSGDSLVPHG